MENNKEITTITNCTEICAVPPIGLRIGSAACLIVRKGYIYKLVEATPNSTKQFVDFCSFIRCNDIAEIN